MITTSLKKVADSRMMLLLLALLCVNGVSAQDDVEAKIGRASCRGRE